MIMMLVLRKIISFDKMQSYTAFASERDGLNIRIDILSKNGSCGLDLHGKGLKMIPKFQRLFKSAYDLDEALERRNLTREGIELLRERIKSAKFIPKFVIDNQVSLEVKVKVQRLIKLFQSWSCFWTSATETST